jgi:hypothetical protein
LLLICPLTLSLSLFFHPPTLSYLYFYAHALVRFVCVHVEQFGSRTKSSQSWIGVRATNTFDLSQGRLRAFRSSTVIFGTIAMTQLTAQMSPNEALQQLPALQRLLDEFYSGCSNPERRHAIELMFGDFCARADSWAFALHVLQQSRNERVLMFCFTLLEQVLARRWLAPDTTLDRSHIRQFLWQFLLQCAADSQPIVGPGTPQSAKCGGNGDNDPNRPMPSFALTKCCKLLAAIAQLDAPHTESVLLRDAINLLDRPLTASVGLQLLLVTLEEFTQPKDDLPAARRGPMLKHLTSNLDLLVTCLTRVLCRNVRQMIGHTNHTPPPSPTHGTGGFSNNARSMNTSIADLLSVTPCVGSQHSCVQLAANVLNIPCDLPPLTEFDSISGSSASSTSQTLRLIEQTLQCVNVLFTWLPTKSLTHVHPSLFQALFVCATAGCGCCSVQPLAPLALSCLNELLAKHCAPAVSQTLHAHAIEPSFVLLNALVDPTPSDALFARLDDKFRAKLIDLLRSFIGNHLSRYRNEPQRVLQFTQLMLTFTLRFGCEEQFLDSLELWTSLLDQLDVMPSAQLQQYSDTLRSLSNELLFRLQMRFNRCKLQILDRERGSAEHGDLFDDEHEASALHANEGESDIEVEAESEFERFVRRNLQLLARLAYFESNHCVQLALHCLDETLSIYGRLQPLIQLTSNDDRPTLNLQEAKSSQIQELQNALDDLLLALRLIEHLAPLLIEENFELRFEHSRDLVARLLQALQMTQQLRLSECNCGQAAVYQSLVRVHIGLMKALQSNIGWFSSFLSFSAPLGQSISHDSSDKAASLPNSYQDHSLCVQMLQALFEQLLGNILRSVPSSLMDELRAANSSVARQPLLPGLPHESVLRASIECFQIACVSLRHPNVLMLWPIQVLLDLAVCCVAPLSNDSQPIQPNWPSNCGLPNCSHSNQLRNSADQKCTRLLLEPNVERSFLGALLSWLVLPSQRLPDAQQQWPRRAEAAEQLLSKLLQPMCGALQAQSSLAESPDCLPGLLHCSRRTLLTVAQLLASHMHSPSRTKQVLFACVQPLLGHSLQLLQTPKALSYPLLGEPLLACLCTALDALRGQVPVASVSAVIEALLQQVHSWSPSDQSDVRGPALLQRICSLFVLLVEQPNAGNRTLLAQLVRATIDQLQPMVAQCAEADLSSAFVDLLYRLLLNHARYFNSEPSDHLPSEPLPAESQAATEAVSRCSEPERQHLRLLHALGQALLQPQPALCRQALQALCALQSRQQLFHRGVFRALLLVHFVRMCLQILATQSHRLLQEELLLLLHQLASVDYSIFTGNVRRMLLDDSPMMALHFRTQLEQTDLLMRVQVDDLQSFSASVTQFVSDCRFYRHVSGTA